MPITLPEAQQVFKIVGKLIYLSDLASPQVNEYAKTSMALVEQAISGLPTDRVVFNRVCSQVEATVSNVINSISGIEPSSTGHINQYFSFVVAPKLGLQAQTSPGTVIDQFIVELNDLGETVLQNGRFHRYFSDTLNKQLPNVASSETIPESWVTNDVV